MGALPGGGCTTSPVGAQFTWASATGGTGMDSSDSGLVKLSTLQFTLNTDIQGNLH